MLKVIEKRLQYNYDKEELELFRSFNDDEKKAYADFYCKNQYKNGVILKPSEYVSTEGYGRRKYRVKKAYGDKEFEVFLSFNKYLQEYYLRYFKSRTREIKPPSKWYETRQKRNAKKSKVENMDLDEFNQKLEEQDEKRYRIRIDKSIKRTKEESVEFIVEKFLNLLRERISEDDAKMYFEMFDRMHNANYNANF